MSRRHDEFRRRRRRNAYMHNRRAPVRVCISKYVPCLHRDEAMTSPKIENRSKYRKQTVAEIETQTIAASYAPAALVRKLDMLAGTPARREIKETLAASNA